MKSKISLFIIIVILITSCKTSTSKPAGDGLTLKEKCIKYFKTAEKNLDIYTKCKGPGKQGVFAVHNKTRKAPATLFIVTINRVIAPGEAGYTFNSAASACSIFSKLPAKTALAANLYLKFSQKRRTYGMLQEKSDVDFYQNKKGRSAPTAIKSGSGYILDFWSKNINTDVFYHLSIKISSNNEVELLSEDSKKFK